MIAVDLARSLRDAGVQWTPQSGDRFVINAEDLTDQVFWISELTVEVQRLQNGDVLGFNGTTEWALDSVTIEKSLWLPREDQLRALLGEMFVSLSRDGENWVVTTVVDSREQSVRDVDAESAYATALLALLH